MSASAMTRSLTQVKDGVILNALLVLQLWMFPPDTNATFFVSVI
jgi:hypothetical protein